MTRNTLTCVTANFWRDNPCKRQDLAELAGTRAHIIGINEGRELVELVGLHVKGYTTVVGHVDHASHQNPILVRDDVDLLGRGARKMCNKVGPSPERWAVYVLFEFEGVRFAYVNTHMNSHVEHNGRPWNLPRTREYIQHMRNLRRLVKDLRHQGYSVIVGGDLNWAFTNKVAQWVWSPKRVFAGLHLEIQWASNTAPAGGSHGSRRIDYQAHDPAHLRIHSQLLLSSHSDHRWSLVSYGVK